MDFKLKSSNGVSNVIVYVNSSISGSIHSEIQRYIQDITKQGYNVTKINWSDTSVNNLNTNITNYYAFSLEGVILIGKLPYAMARNWDSAWGRYWHFLIDLFLMDLDGLWNDLNFNGFYDIEAGEHVNGTGDWEPEIWLGRLRAKSLDDPQFNEITKLRKYFDRNHDYRTGEISRPNKAILYIDDEWSSVTNEWLSNFTAYIGGQVDCFSINGMTTAGHYLMQLQTQQYEFVHLLVHS